MIQNIPYTYVIPCKMIFFNHSERNEVFHFIFLHILSYKTISTSQQSTWRNSIDIFSPPKVRLIEVGYSIAKFEVIEEGNN